MAIRYYAAYGSNLNVRQMQSRCPGAQAIGISTIDGYRLMFKGSKTGAYLTIEKENGCSVPVAVWSVTSADEKALDRYEGFPSFYYKKEFVLPVRGCRSGGLRDRTVFAYIMHEERSFGIPSRCYMSTCFEGYRNFNFPIETLMEAHKFSKTKVGALYENA